MVANSIKVYGRLKPISSNIEPKEYHIHHLPEFSSDILTLSRLIGDPRANKKERLTFRFHKVFDETSKQEDIFEIVAKPVVESVLCGYSGTVFAYGQTGSGKTFTITGGVSKYEDRGIIPRSIQHIFRSIHQNQNVLFTVYISYLEIYNEHGFDLMVPKHDVSKLEDLPHVTLLEDADGNLHLRNLSVHCVASEEEALNLLFLGDTNRIVSETPMNPHSSRSHCVFTMHLASHNKHSSTVRRCKLNLVDLAGSERVYKSQIDGRTLVEARNINLSLHFLEQVILALGETGRNHIPYRNSIMTSILRDSLGGNCLTVMVATLSVSSNNTEETVSTCRFAQRVAFVHNEVSVNEELDPQKEIAMLRAEVHELRGQLARLSGERESSELSSIDIEDCQNLVKQYLQSEPGTSEFGLLHNEKKVQLCYSFLKDAMLKAQERVKHQESEQMQMEQKFQEHIQQRDREISILISLLKKEKKRYQEAMAQNDKETGSLQRLEFISSTDEFPVLMSHFEEPVAGNYIHTTEQVNLVLARLTCI